MAATDHSTSPQRWSPRSLRLAVFGLAGERAAASAAGPGSLRWRIVDELALLDETIVRAGVKIA